MHDRMTAARVAGWARKWAPARAAALLAAMLATAAGLPATAGSPAAADSIAAAGGAAVHAPAVRTPAVEPESLPLPAAVRRLPVIAPPPGAMPALGDACLAELRGGTETPWSDMRLSGTVGSNTAVNVVTGSNHITDGAFSNASGLPMVIQNSGSNVLIQNATIVNVQIR